ncbi:hypothetical protein H9Y04_04985 [Streptomyces sp. TRM66268-LWL]|uniref:Uncharacterized protein n=1 Tax=Streptomyces polyasparticus TaxID=2767826 RepID=A0ABR7SAZ0_9ACTN|nr:hypothetical protein [Streptomyces polyasparticus]MBC9711925.1 hypothetical protein [Streptomyces polyasparticus]
MLLGKAISTGYAEEKPLVNAAAGSEEPAEAGYRAEEAAAEADAPVEVPAG